MFKLCTLEPQKYLLAILCPRDTFYLVTNSNSYDDNITESQKSNFKVQSPLSQDYQYYKYNNT